MAARQPTSDGDVQPTAIFNTVSEAADRVSKAVTPARVREKELPLAQVFERSKGKSFTKNENQFVTASFQDPLSKVALATADFSGVDLSFKNPFASLSRQASAATSTSSRG